MGAQRVLDFPIVIQSLTVDELATAASVLAEGMRDNPLHVLVFGRDKRRRQQRLRRFLGHVTGHVEANGMLLGAYSRDELVGVLGMAEPGRCRPQRARALLLAVAIVVGNTPAGTWRISRWLAAWNRADPREPHWHVGPLAVLPEWRGRGVGRDLMQYACRHIDALSSAAWLETDRLRNVAFYARFGFALIRSEPVLGVRNWFMRRGPR